jgi:hypothetical protein
MVKVVEGVEICADPIAIRVKPRTGSDPVPRVNGVITLGAQISAPGQMTLIDAFRQVLADLIRPRQTSQVATVAGALTCDEERHWPGGRLRLSQAREKEAAERHAAQYDLIIVMHR